MLSLVLIFYFKISYRRLILPFMEYGLAHSMDFFGAFVVGLFEIDGFCHFGPALRGFRVFGVVDQLLLVFEIFLFALAGLLLLFLEELFKPLVALLFAFLFQRVLMILNN
jgi:hypothetical protein